MSKFLPKTSFKQKIGLLVFGIFISLIVLEIILRITGSVFLYLQEKKNQSGYTGADVFTILCLGESTTALGGDNSYPVQLEEILNSKNSERRYKVINKGVPSITTEYVYENLPKQLKKYKPDLVVTMIGINDHITKMELSQSMQERVSGFLSGFRVVKFVNMAVPYVKGQVKKNREEAKIEVEPEVLGSSDEDLDLQRPRDELFKNVAEVSQASDAMNKMITQAKITGKTENENEILSKFQALAMTEMKLNVAIGRWYSGRGQLVEAEKYFQQALEADERNVVPYIQLGRCYRKQGKFNQAMEMYKKAGILNSKVPVIYLEMARLYRNIKQVNEARKMYQFIVNNKIGDHWMYLESADYFSQHDFFSDAEKAYQLATVKDPRSSNAYDRLGKLYLRQNKFESAEKNYQKALQYNSHKSIIYKGLSETYQSQNRPADSLEYARKAEQIETQEVNTYTLHYYQMISRIILEKNVKMISMQYPMLSNQALMKRLKKSDKITFVANKDNFESALSNLEYSEYFSDNFAGDFGHCTVKCNRLIAENLADAVLEILN